MKSNMSIIIVVFVIILIDVIGGYFIGKKVLIPYSYEKEMAAGSAEGPEFKKEGGEKGTEAPGLKHQLEPIALNPANSAGEVFSCTMTLVYQVETLEAELTSRDTQITDIILTYLSAKTIAELNDVSQRETYRKEMTEKINAVLTGGTISNIYITQWIIQ